MGETILIRTWVPCKEDDIYCAIHRPRSGSCIAVCIILPAFGEEKKSSIRTVVDMCTLLAQNGILAVRFDYAGTGDSTGELRKVRIRDWVENAHRIVQFARGIGGEAPVHLVGIRFGALIAIRTATLSGEIAGVTLVDPIIDAGKYLSELKRMQFALQVMTRGSIRSISEISIRILEDGYFDFYGYVTSNEFWEEARELLCSSRDAELHGNIRVVVRERSMNVFSSSAYSAYGKDTRLFPHLAGKYWEMQLKSSGVALADGVLSTGFGDSDVYKCGSLEVVRHNRRNEEIVEFGKAGYQLRGIVHHPACRSNCSEATIALPGEVGYRAGPHDMVVHLARRQAMNGSTVLRIDFRGCGESGDPGAEWPGNNEMFDDIRTSNDYLQSRQLSLKCIVGLCGTCEPAVRFAQTVPSIRLAVLLASRAITELSEVEQPKVSRIMSTQSLLKGLTKTASTDWWRRLVSGDIDLKPYIGLFRTEKSKVTGPVGTPVRGEMKGFSFKGPYVCINGSSHDKTKLFLSFWRDMAARHKIVVTLKEVEGADDIFSSQAWEKEVIDTIERGVA